MVVPVSGAVPLVVALLLATAPARAECARDTDCGGDRVCESGACVAPRPQAPTRPAQADAAGMPSDPALTPSAKSPAPPETEPSRADSAARATPVHGTPPGSMQMRSPALFGVGVSATVVGTGLVSFGFVQAMGDAFCKAGSAIPSEGDPYEATGETSAEDGCGGGAGIMMIAGLAIAAIGIPLIAIGAKRVPAATSARAALVPVAVPKGAGLGFRLEL
jgi:hypothetical protein